MPSPARIPALPEPRNVALFGNGVLADALSEVTVRSYWITAGPESSICVFIRRGEGRQRDRREIGRETGGHVRVEADLECLGYKSRNPWNHQKLEEAGGTRPLRWSPALPTPGRLTASLQNCERTNSCCLKPNNRRSINFEVI